MYVLFRKERYIEELIGMGIHLGKTNFNGFGDDPTKRPGVDLDQFDSKRESFNNKLKSISRAVFSVGLSTLTFLV